MIKVEGRHDFVPKENPMLSTYNMVPISPEMQELLQPYGVKRHMMAYFNRDEPNRIYVNTNGQLHFIDLPMINQTNGTTVQNLALKACELAQNDPTVRNDLENELSKVLQRVLSKIAEKHNKNDTKLASKCMNTSTWQMLTDSEREELQRERRKKNAYKTSLCRSFRENNTCPYEDECVFAHGEKELRLPPQAHPKYKTQLCNKFSVWNYCPYGARCQYIHQRVNGMSTKMKKDFERIDEKNFPSATSKDSSKCFLTKQMNKSVEYANSPIALGNYSSFVEHGGFSSSLTNTNFNTEKKQEQSFKVSNLFDLNCLDHDNNKYHHDKEAIANSIILNQIHESFNNMNIEDNDNMFSRSCFSRIGSNSGE
ncbi:mRNA decay activator protein [Dirofilaria immitis]